jgi:hypothetical protein
VPLEVTGGHAAVHAPEHADMPLESLDHTYTARPEPSVRIVPPDALAVVMAEEPDELPPAAALPDAAGADELPAAPVLLVPLAHAATSTAAAAAPPIPVASFAGPDIRFTMEYFIVCSSPV